MKSLLFSALLTLCASSSFARGVLITLPEGSTAQAGSIVVHVSAKRLDFIYDNGHAIRYPIATPKKGAEWKGAAHINGMYLRPAWIPPKVVRRDHPEMPAIYPSGARDNPMGEAAMTLDRDQFAIHGTSYKTRGSIGTSASYGCMRMLNEDVLDLFQRVHIGTLVIVKP